ncbi:septum formation initiator family protein, partial [Patescibacteria group bacterium]
QSNLFHLIILVVGFGMVIGLSRSAYDIWKRQDVIVQRENALKELEDENNRLKRELESAESPEFIEKEARKTLGLAKPGETIVLMQKSTISAEARTKRAEKPQEKPSWKVWWSLFFGENKP